MLFHFVAFPYMHYSQSYGTSNTKGCDFEKWVEYQEHAYLRDKNNRAAVYVGETLVELNLFLSFFLKIVTE